jgi:putative endonuclease
MKYYVYIIQSLKDKSLYTGITTNLKKRLEMHNYGGSKYTSKKLPYKLIWYSSFLDKYKAYKFEKYLKTGSGIAFLKKHLI